MPLLEPISPDPEERLAIAKAKFEVRYRICDAAFKYVTWIALIAAFIVTAERTGNYLFGFVGTVLFTLTAWSLSSVTKFASAAYIRPEEKNALKFFGGIILYICLVCITFYFIWMFIQVVNGFVLLGHTKV